MHSDALVAPVKTGNPDGGVEWYVRLIDGTVHGFRCKVRMVGRRFDTGRKAKHRDNRTHRGARNATYVEFLIPFDLGAGRFATAPTWGSDGAQTHPRPVGYAGSMPVTVPIAADPIVSSRAQRLVARVKAMPIEDLRARLEESRQMSADEVVARQSVERRQRAEQAAARLRSH